MPRHRLAAVLVRVFQVLRILCIVALVLLVPAMLFAWAFPDQVQPGGTTLRVNGVPVTTDRPLIAGTMLLFANVVLIAAVVMLGKLGGMMRSVVAGMPFTLENVARLRAIAATMGVLIVFQAVGGLFVTTAQRAAFDIKVGQFDFGLFLGMLVVLVLAEVFREGVRLADENEGTI